MKPGRNGLSKQRATANLQLQQPQPQRPVLERKAKKSLEPEVEPMETEEINDVEMPEAPEIPAAVGQIEDIDSDDVGNPQLIVEYVNEIYCYLRALERKQAIKEDYLKHMDATKLLIKPKMRNLLVDWLVDVHIQFALLQETLYLTVAILDRYLMLDAESVTTKQLQLVGVTAMFLASKYEEMYPPEIGDFIYISDRAYTETQIRKMEIRIIKTLDFDLGRPLPINFLRRGSKAGTVNAQVHGLAKYVMELSIVDYKMAHVEPSRVAAASLALAIRLMDPVQSSLIHLWSRTLEHYTSYKLVDLQETISSLAHSVHTIYHVQGVNVTEVESAAGGKKVKVMRSVCKKYSNKKFMKTALLPQLTSLAAGQCLEKMAQGEL